MKKPYLILPNYCAVLLFLSAPLLSFAADKKDAGAAATPTPTAPLITCSTEIRYKWKRLPAPLKDGMDAQKGKATHPAPDPELQQPVESFSSLLKEDGSSEEALKAEIEALLPSAEARAMNECIELHQNLGSCAAKKIGSISSQLERMDFETKRALREQLLEDCRGVYGVCLSTLKSEISCKQEATPAPAATEAPAAKDPKKK